MTAANEGPDKATLKSISETCVNFRLRRVSRILASLYDDALRPTGLRSTQYNQLVLLETIGETTVKDLAKALAVDRTSLSRSLEPLTRIGLVSSRPGADGRERLIQLTRKGRSALQNAIPLWQAAQSAVIRALGDETVKKLVSTANSIEQSLAASESAESPS